MKVTVDTNFLISATQWDYSVSHRLLLRLIEKDVKIYTTSEILNELNLDKPLTCTVIFSDFSGSL